MDLTSTVICFLLVNCPVISGSTFNFSVLEEVPIGYIVGNVMQNLIQEIPTVKKNMSLIKEIILIKNDNFKIINSTIIVTRRIDRENPETCKPIIANGTCGQTAQLLVELSSGIIRLFPVQINILGMAFFHYIN